MAERRRVPVTVVGRRGDVGGVVVGPEEAQRRRIDTILRQACTNGVLRLANRGLSEVPREVFFLHEMNYQDKRWWEEQQLTTFDVSHNQLTSLAVPLAESHSKTAEEERQGGLPDPLGAFSSLRLITAAYNQLRAFPRSLVVCCAQTLTKLDLSHNRLVELPFTSPAAHDTAAGRPCATAGVDAVILPNLLELDLSHNELGSFDVSLSTTCPSLEKLNLSHNGIRCWEGRERSGVLRCLRDLRLSHNRLQCLIWTSSVGHGSGKKEELLTVSQVFPALQHLDASYNELVALFPPCAGNVPFDSKAAPIPVFPAALVTLNLKRNRLSMWPARRIGTLSSLKELYLGNNQLCSDVATEEDENSLEFYEGQCLSLEMLDVSNNRLGDVRRLLLPLRSSLSRVDLSNNNISSLPPELGRFPKMTAVVLDGNPLRSIRRDVVAKGTQELLAFLRDRDTNSATLCPPGNRVVVEPLPQAGTAPLSCSASVGVGAHRGPAAGVKPSGKVDDRPFATEWNCERRSAETKLVEDACVRGGEHAGGLWDLSWRGARTTQCGIQPSAHKSLSPAGRVVAAASGTGQSLRLPATVDGTLNLSELHHSAEQRFRELVHTIRIDEQPDVTMLSLTFVQNFPKLKEISCFGCSQLSSVTFPSMPEELASLSSGAFLSLTTLDFSRCGFRTTDVATTASTLDVLFTSFAERNVPIARLNLARNSQLVVLPRAIAQIRDTLQYLRLDDNPQFASQRQLPHALFQALHPLHELLELSLVRCCMSDIPADGDAAVGAARFGDQRSLSHVAAVGFSEGSWPKLLSLDLSYNDLRTVPASLGRMRAHLRTLNLEGNAIRWLRSDCVAKGTAFVLQYLYDKLPLVPSASTVC